MAQPPLSPAVGAYILLLSHLPSTSRVYVGVRIHTTVLEPYKKSTKTLYESYIPGVYTWYVAGKHDALPPENTRDKEGTHTK